MKTKSENYNELKMFCIATLIFYCLFFVLFALGVITQLFGYDFFMRLSGLLETPAVALLIIGAYLSPVWLLTTIIWCAVVCKREHSIRYFFKPLVIINIFLSLIFPQIMISCF